MSISSMFRFFRGSKFLHGRLGDYSAKDLYYEILFTYLFVFSCLFLLSAHSLAGQDLCSQRKEHLQRAREMYPGEKNITRRFELYRQQYMTEEEKQLFPVFINKYTDPCREQKRSSQQSSIQWVQCSRVIDGDTIEIQRHGKIEKVRLIGVDTPETVHPSKPVEHFGREASKFTRNMVEGKNVTLEYDWQLRDRYGRLLAYVYLEDGTFLNAEILKQGYGFAYIKYPFKRLDEFREYEKQASENNLGLWR